MLRKPTRPMAHLSLDFIVVIMLMATLRAHAFHLPLTSPSMRLHLSTASQANKEIIAVLPSENRRKIIQQSSAAIASLLLPLQPAFASDDETSATQQPSEPYTRTPSPNDKFKFGYTVTPPPSFVAGNKPLKTHLDEINFSPEGIRGYTLGITVDPVRIKNIQAFGTPEEVAARVVTAEINRDGVFTVTLAKDPTEDTAAGCYDIEYISDGKRGTKRFVTRIYIKDGFLYVLTAQSKEAEYDKVREADVMECVKSFRPLSE
ncbi:hypothetical protein ACHAXR_013568 [Thalassiosira sp. AJA248-18]